MGATTSDTRAFLLAALAIAFGTGVIAAASECTTSRPTESGVTEVAGAGCAGGDALATSPLRCLAAPLGAFGP